jgi:hypothetical protein
MSSCNIIGQRNKNDLRGKHANGHVCSACILTYITYRSYKKLHYVTRCLEKTHCFLMSDIPACSSNDRKRVVLPVPMQNDLIDENTCLIGLKSGKYGRRKMSLHSDIQSAKTKKELCTTYLLALQQEPVFRLHGGCYSY